MKISLSPKEVERAISSYLIESLNTGSYGWKLITPDHVDGYLEFEEIPPPPNPQPKAKP